MALIGPRHDLGVLTDWELGGKESRIEAALVSNRVRTKTAGNGVISSLLNGRHGERKSFWGAARKARSHRTEAKVGWFRPQRAVWCSLAADTMMRK